MLLRGSADYITGSKVACMIDLFPLKKTKVVFPSPRVLNTHYRLDVLPIAFRGKKTVVGNETPLSKIFLMTTFSFTIIQLFALSILSFQYKN